jgi:hypothetical protein
MQVLPPFFCRVPPVGTPVPITAVETARTIESAAIERHAG